MLYEYIALMFSGLPAFRKDEIDMFQSLHMLAEVDKDVYTICSSKTGQTLIHSAVESCNPHIVQDILETRHDALYDKDKDGKFPQHYAAALQEYFLLEFLLSQGADICETYVNIMPDCLHLSCRGV